MRTSFTLFRTTLAVVILALLVVLLVYVQKQYQQKLAEAQLDLERRETAAKIRLYAKKLAEENAKNPIKMPVDPFSPPPSDAEELAQIKLWHQSPPELRKHLMPTPDKLSVGVASQELT